MFSIEATWGRLWECGRSIPSEVQPLIVRFQRLRLTCEQKIVTPYVEAEPSRRGMHNARSQARKDKMREDTRDHFKSMQRLKDMSFREHVKYERKKQAASAPSL